HGQRGGVDAGEVVVAGTVNRFDVVLVEVAGIDSRVRPQISARGRPRRRWQRGILDEAAVIDGPQDEVAGGLVASVVLPAYVDFVGAYVGDHLVGRLGRRQRNADAGYVRVARIACRIEGAQAVVEGATRSQAGGRVGERVRAGR